MKIKSDQYKYLLGKDKNEISKELGHEFNFYPADIWTFILKINWIGRKKILVLYFNDEKVVKIEILKAYGKFKT